MRLWIEHGFSRLPIADRMSAADPELEIISSTRQTARGRRALDVPPSTEEIASLVREHAIDAFWPQKSALGDLSSLPCVVHAPGTPDTLRLVDDKTAFMEWLGDDQHRPDQVEVLGVDGVEREWSRRRSMGRATCVKPAVGVNGHGYWRLLDAGGHSFLDDPEPREIDGNIWMAAMHLAEEEGPPRRILVMDWLPGPEVSVDILCWYGRPLVHAARIKTEPGRQTVTDDHPVTRHANAIVERLALHGIVSVQYRLDDQGDWRILEVNARPAGGSIHSEDAGFPLITDWTRLLTGDARPEDLRQVRASRRLRFVTRAVIERDRTP